MLAASLLLNPLKGTAQVLAFDFLIDYKNSFSEVDSALTNPDGVNEFYFDCSDSVDFKYNLESLEKWKDKFINLSQVTFGIQCTLDTFPLWLFELPSLNRIDAQYNPLIYQIPESCKLKLTKIALAAPPGIDQQAWLKMFYDLANIEVLSIKFGHSITIDEDIQKLKNLKKLYIWANGDIKYPNSFRNLSSLKSFSIDQCWDCVSFPDVFPESIESIDIRYTHIEKISSNINSLKHLRHLDLSYSKVLEFPKGFNFSQLEYFAAPKDLFSEEEWLDIQKKVKNVVVTLDLNAINGGNPPNEKRN